MEGNKTKWRYFLLGAFLLLTPLAASADEKITKYEVEIEVKEDSSLHILESIHYDFGDAQRRGIFRDIPYKYETDIGKRKVDIEVLEVTADGFEAPFKVSRQGSYVTTKIGDPDVFITGEHVYRISYTVKGAFNSFEDFDEIYWNAVGHSWSVPIDRVTVNIVGLDEIARTGCFYGLYNATAKCILEPLLEGGLTVSIANLAPREGLTVVVGYEKGFLTLPTKLQKIWWLLSANPYWILPIIVVVYMHRRWKKFGKDAKGTGTIVPQYAPPMALNPMYLGSVVDGTLDSRDITAGIIYLAEQGLMNIIRLEDKRLFGKDVDYKLIWRGDFKDIQEKDKLLVKLLFGEYAVKGEEVTLSTLLKDTSLQGRRRDLQEHIDEELMRTGYFANKPAAVRQKWAIIAGTSSILALVLFSVNVILGISAFISILIIGGYGLLMPKRTKSGAELREKILGFKDFLNVTLKDRLDFHNAPERSPKQFMEYLPFAIALGVEDKWQKQFEDITIENPSWYKSTSSATFATSSFMTDISNLHSSLSNSVTPAASGGSGTGGGGFSGGGMGGGGGGSW